MELRSDLLPPGCIMRRLSKVGVLTATILSLLKGIAGAFTNPVLYTSIVVHSVGNPNVRVWVNRIQVSITAPGRDDMEIQRVVST